MADLKITGLPDGTAAQATDIVPAARGAGNVRLTLALIKSYVLSGMGIAWSAITGTPTTRAGYGIVDAEALGAAAAEAALRAAADTALQTNITTNATAITAETAARTTADTTHAALSTTAHGGIVASSDSRLADARTPTAHAHVEGDVTALIADLASKQPLDSDLTAIALLSTTAFGRSFLTLADAAAALTLTGAQPIDSDLTAIAALTTTSYGRSLLTAADAAALRTLAGAGAGSVTSVGISVSGVLHSVSGSPITGSGTIALGLLTQTANTVLAGPASGAAATPTMRALVAADLPVTGIPAQIGVAVSDETTVITTGAAKLTFRMPFAMTLSSVRASLKTASSSGLPAINIKESGVTIFSTTLTINVSSKTSVGATTPAVISDPNLADDAEMTVDIDTAGTGAVGLKLWLIGVRA